MTLPRCLNNTAVRGAGPAYKRLVYMALKPPNIDLPFGRPQVQEDDEVQSDADDYGGSEDDPVCAVSGYR